MATRMVAVNEAGRRIGEDQTGAKLTNHEVEMLLTMREQGMGYGTLAKVFEVSKSLVRDIIKGRRRGQTVARFKQVRASA